MLSHWFWIIAWPIVTSIIAGLLTQKYGHAWGLLLDKLIKIPLKFLHLNTIYQLFQKNRQLFLFAIVFYVLTTPSSLLFNKIIALNSPLHIYRNLTSMEQTFLNVLWFQNNGLNIYNPYEGKLKSNKIDETSKKLLTEEIKKTWSSLQKNKLIEPVLPQQSTTTLYRITPKGNKVFLSDQPKDYKKSFELFHKID